MTVDPDGGQTHVPFTLTAVDSGETLLPDLEITAKGFGRSSGSRAKAGAVRVTRREAASGDGCGLAGLILDQRHPMAMSSKRESY